MQNQSPHHGAVGYESNSSTSAPCGGAGSILSLAQSVKGSGTAATVAWVTATAWIQPLAQEIPYAASAAIKKKKKKQNHEQYAHNPFFKGYWYLVEPLLP